MITFAIAYFFLSLFRFLLFLVPSGPNLPSSFTSAVSWLASSISPVFFFIDKQAFVNVLSFFSVFIPAYLIFRLIIFIFSRGSSSKL